MALNSTGSAYRLVLAFIAGCCAITSINGTATESPPIIGVIIDDLGDRWRDGKRAIELPAAFTYGILPYAPYTARLATLAAEHNKEVILHLPMQAESGKPLGKGGLHEEMGYDEFLQTLRADLRAVPNIRGVNNHMGSLLTARAPMMEWLMAELARHDGALYFVDSLTTERSVARRTARRHGVAHGVRDIFLDNQRDSASMQRQWQALIARAKLKGSALGIAHPYPETLAFLSEAVTALPVQGVVLLPVSEVINAQQHRSLVWQTSSSP